MSNREERYSVYVHTCPNGKRYVGATKLPPVIRWGKNGCNYHKALRPAIDEFGWDNIKHEVLFVGLTKEEAEKKEVELIAQYKSNHPEYGYNLTVGGFSTKGENNPFYGKKHTEETKRVMREKWRYDSHFTEETIKKMSVATSGENNPRYGKALTEAEKVKDMISQKTRKCVAQYSLDGECIATYKSTREAARAINKSHKYISRACRGLQKNTYGCIWSYIGG